MGKVILHIDLNYFFVRCEELINPALIGKPVAIGREGRAGIISTCSYAARKYGVCSGQPTYKALECCKDLILLPGDFEFYKKKSDEFFEFLHKYTDLIEQASIDECFVDITNIIKNNKDPIKFVLKIQENLVKETGLYCSIGIAPTKFLAKMGSDLKKPLGLTIIHKRDAKEILSPLKIGDFYGIGKKSVPVLKKMGIETIGDLIYAIENRKDELINYSERFYLYCKSCLNGESSDEVIAVREDSKSISHSHTLKFDTDKIEEILEYIDICSKEVSEDAKKDFYIGNLIQITLKDINFKLITRSKKIDKFTNDYEVIKLHAAELVRNNYDGRNVRLVGVGLGGLIDKSTYHEQLSIFDDFDKIEDESKTKILINKVNRHFKKEVLMTAREAIKKGKTNGYK